MVRTCLLAAVLAVAASAAPAVPAVAAATDCSTASAKMMQMAHQPMPAMPTAASVDTTFSMMMSPDMMKHDMAMAQIEAECGKDAKQRAAAKKMVELIQEYTDYARKLQQGF